MRTIIILALTCWVSLIVLAVYEWQWLVVACLVALVFLFRGMGKQRLPSAPLGTHHTKEDDAP